MIRRLYTVLLLLCIVGFGLTAVGAMAQTEGFIKKTDNFCLFLDHSSSMKQDYQGLGTKISVAKGLLLDMNGKIPQLAYTGALYTFAPYAEYRTFVRHEQTAMRGALEKIDTEYSAFFNMRNTPIGNGLKALAPTLEPLAGRMDLIIVTDGGQNAGDDPVKVANGLVAKYGDRLCIHVISLAETPEEKAVIAALSKVTPCNVTALATALKSSEAMDKFVQDVFYTKGTKAAAAQPAAMSPTAVAAPTQAGASASVSAPGAGATPGAAMTPDSAGAVAAVSDKLTAAPAPAAPAQAAAAPMEAPVQEPEVIVLRGVQFDLDEAALKPEFVPILDEAVATLKARPDIKVSVEGHTCDLAGEAYNQKLSERRAHTVWSYLVKHGIAVDRLTTVGFGESKPRFDNSTREGRVKNRRVELVVR